MSVANPETCEIPGTAEADLKRFGQKGETKENAETDTVVTSEFTTERYKQIGKFFVKFIQKKVESESINMFVDKYGTVLGEN